MKFYVSKGIDLALPEEEYKNVKDEDKGKFEELEIDLKIGEELAFSEMDSHMTAMTNDDILDHISVQELLNNKSASYQVTKMWAINIEFEVLKEKKLEEVEKNEMNLDYIELFNLKEVSLLESLIKITNIELV